MPRANSSVKKDVFIIAEAGVNHNGNFKIAKKMINAAVDSGADAVKFQTFKSKEAISRFAEKADYQKKTTDGDESQLEMAKKLELDISEHKRLMAYCRKKGIMFLSSPFDLKSIDLLHSLGLKILKIPSGEITNLPYLEKIGGLHKKIIMSTGMSDLKTIGKALDILRKAGTPKKNISVLHCTTEYPAPYEDVNLLAMLTIRNHFKVRVGYSDHTLGIEVAIAAAALGASIIEKHFTLDRNMKGPDHKASLEPDELKEMIKAVRNVEKSMGSGVKKASNSELKNRDIARKSIVASTYIKKGEIFNESNITVKRPGIGISPMAWESVIGMVARKDFNEDEVINL